MGGVDNQYVPNSAIQLGHSIRCDLSIMACSRISFSYDGILYKDIAAPYYMNGDSHGRVSEVRYLKNGCGAKTVTIYANDSSHSQAECFRQTFRLTANCSVT
jgi:hypothetical protein